METLRTNLTTLVSYFPLIIRSNGDNRRTYTNEAIDVVQYIQKNQPKLTDLETMVFDDSLGQYITAILSENFNWANECLGNIDAILTYHETCGYPIDCSRS